VIVRRAAAVFAILSALAAGPAMPAAESAGAPPPPAVVLDGAVKHPGQFDLETLRRLPAQHLQVSFLTEHGTTSAGFTGPRLWTVLEAAGGLADDKKGAAIRHVIRVSGRDGYYVVLSTGEIAPDFGGKAAIIATQRDGEPSGASGLRLILPGDRRGGRDVRDVVSIRVE
jgi:protein involved in polysaccharide export with SLBB domain